MRKSENAFFALSRKNGKKCKIAKIANFAILHFLFAAFWPPYRRYMAYEIGGPSLAAREPPPSARIIQIPHPGTLGEKTRYALQ